MVVDPNSQILTEVKLKILFIASMHRKCNMCMQDTFARTRTQPLGQARARRYNRVSVYKCNMTNYFIDTNH